VTIIRTSWVAQLCLLCPAVLWVMWFRYLRAGLFRYAKLPLLVAGGSLALMLYATPFHSWVASSKEDPRWPRGTELFGLPTNVVLLAVVFSGFLGLAVDFRGMLRSRSDPIGMRKAAARIARQHLVIMVGVSAAVYALGDRSGWSA